LRITSSVCIAITWPPLVVVALGLGQSTGPA
jgi:hypothetical protein